MCFGNVLGDVLGMFWVSFGYVLVGSGVFWGVLDCSKVFWDVLGWSEVFWDILGVFCCVLGVSWGVLSVFCDVLGVFWDLQVGVWVCSGSFSVCSRYSDVF